MFNIQISYNLYSSILNYSKSYNSIFLIYLIRLISFADKCFFPISSNLTYSLPKFIILTIIENVIIVILIIINKQLFIVK